MSAVLSKRSGPTLGLIVLAIATAALCAAAVWRVQPRTVGAVPAAVQSTASAQSSASPTPEPSPTTSTASPSPTPTPSSTAEKAGGIRAVRDLFSSDADTSIVVYGDQSSNGRSEWVRVWAREHLAANHRVEYSAWDPEADAYGEAERFGDAGSNIKVFNASLSDDERARSDEHIEQASKPADLVIYSYGHGMRADNVPSLMKRVQTAGENATKAGLTLVMMQSPALPPARETQRTTVASVETWAKKEKFATVDLYNAFTEDPAPLVELVKTDGSLTKAGGKLWARTVADELATG